MKGINKGDNDHSQDTRCIHAGVDQSRPEFGLNTPIGNATAFDYREFGVRYPRYHNTLNHEVVAERLAALEGGESALVTASGMGALAAIFFSLMGPGDHAVVLEGVYGGTTDLIDGLLVPLGLRFSRWDGCMDSLPALLTPHTRMIHVESPTNPLLRLVDLAEVAALARTKRITTVVDSTFATPIVQQPLRLGIDLVMHSGTKYLGGHSDLLCGAVVGSSRLIERIRSHAARLGSSLNATDLALLERSLKTLSVRVRQQAGNAARIAEWLAHHPVIKSVHYPGLLDHPEHALVAAQMHSAGAMVSFHLAAGVDPDKFLNALQLVQPAVSLGGVETTISQPTRTSHAKLTAEERGRLGIDDSLMRLSVGIEHADDLIHDLDQALYCDSRDRFDHSHV